MALSPSIFTPRDALLDSFHFDNRFRLSVSLSSFVIAGVLRGMHFVVNLSSLATVIVVYNVIYLTVWYHSSRLRRLDIYRFALSLVDFAAITLAIHWTGGLHSPFFYLYPIPFLVHSLHFDLGLIAFDAVVSLVTYFVLLRWENAFQTTTNLTLGVGQLVFLVVMILAAIYTSLRFRRNAHSIGKSVLAEGVVVGFLQNLNSVSPTLSKSEMEKTLVVLLQNALKPLGLHGRLWILNSAWKTLQGLGEHPAMRPGSPHHLPTVACPAFALRRPFHYNQTESDPCPSEQFNYAKHICLPVSNENQALGIIFIGSYQAAPWDAQESHVFEMLGQAIGLALQRKALFESLQDKITELDSSFEVGATGMATFIGSTQSIDETTVHILDGVLSILKVDCASLMLWDPARKQLQTQWVRGGDFRIQSAMSLEMGQGMAGWALHSGEPYWAEYAMGDPHYVKSARPIQSLLCVPVYTMDRQPLGVINAVTLSTPRSFLSREINFLKWFGRQAALAIENAQLHQRSRDNIDQLHELNAMKSHFLSLVSHDLRGPLTGVRGFCEVLKQLSLGPLNTSQMEILDHLERQVDLQERMVDDLLDFARMEKGKFSIHPTPSDLGQVLVEEVGKSQCDAHERHIHLRLEEPILPPLMIDGGRIRQVIWNLIHNAIKFTPEGGRINVRARVEGSQVRVDFEDSGVGLSTETQNHIFEKFFQVSPGGSKGAQGLGLGLAICKEIILAHGGSINAHSAGLGQGTTMSFQLPVSQSRSQSLTFRAA